MAFCFSGWCGDLCNNELCNGIAGLGLTSCGIGTTCYWSETQEVPDSLKESYQARLDKFACRDMEVITNLVGGNGRARPIHDEQATEGRDGDRFFKLCDFSEDEYYVHVYNRRPYKKDDEDDAWYDWIFNREGKQCNLIRTLSTKSTRKAWIKWKQHIECLDFEYTGKVAKGEDFEAYFFARYYAVNPDSDLIFIEVTRSSERKKGDMYKRLVAERSRAPTRVYKALSVNEMARDLSRYTFPGALLTANYSGLLTFANAKDTRGTRRVYGSPSNMRELVTSPGCGCSWTSILSGMDCWDGRFAHILSCPWAGIICGTADMLPWPRKRTTFASNAKESCSLLQSCWRWIQGIESDAEDTWKCDKCKKKNPVSARKCKKKGCKGRRPEDVEDPEDSGPEPTRPPSPTGQQDKETGWAALSTGVKILIIAGSLLLLAIIVGLIVYFCSVDESHPRGYGARYQPGPRRRHRRRGHSHRRGYRSEL